MQDLAIVLCSFLKAPVLAATCLWQAATAPEHRLIAGEVPLSPLLTIGSPMEECAVLADCPRPMTTPFVAVQHRAATRRQGHTCAAGTLGRQNASSSACRG